MSNGPHDDVPAKIATAFRSVSRTLGRYSSAFAIIVGVLNFAGFILAFYDPTILTEIGSIVLLVLESDVTHTFLLVVLIVIVVMTRPGNRGPVKRADGGEPDAFVQLGVAVLFSLGVGILLGTFGNEFVVPGMLLGLLFFLILSNN